MRPSSIANTKTIRQRTSFTSVVLAQTSRQFVMTEDKAAAPITEAAPVDRGDVAEEVQLVVAKAPHATMAWADHQHAEKVQLAVAKAYIDGSNNGLVRVFISWTPATAHQPLLSQITTIIPGNVSVELRELVGLMTTVGVFRTLATAEMDVRMSLACSKLTPSSLLNTEMIAAGFPLMLHAAAAFACLPAVTWLEGDEGLECAGLAVDPAAKANELMVDGEELRRIWSEVLALKREREEGMVQLVVGSSPNEEEEEEDDEEFWFDVEKRDGETAPTVIHDQMKVRCYVAGMRQKDIGTVTIAALIEVHHGSSPDGSIWLIMDLEAPNPSTLIQLTAQLMCLEYLSEHLLLDKQWWPDICIYVLTLKDAPFPAEREYEFPLLSRRLNELVGALRVQVEPMVAGSSKEIEDFVKEMVADDNKPFSTVLDRYQESQALFMGALEVPTISRKRKVASIEVDNVATKPVKKRKPGCIDRFVECYTDGSGKNFGGAGAVITIKGQGSEKVSHITGSAPLPILQFPQLTSQLAEWAGLLLCLDMLERNRLSDCFGENKHYIRICSDLMDMTKAMELESMKYEKLGVDEICWVARQKNHIADKLAGIASNGNLGWIASTDAGALPSDIIDVLRYTSEKWGLEKRKEG
ncbi:hypothetical protein HK101_003463, partial [Irineochytrium annulatum]